MTEASEDHLIFVILSQNLISKVQEISGALNPNKNCHLHLDLNPKLEPAPPVSLRSSESPHSFTSPEKTLYFNNYIDITNINN